MKSRWLFWVGIVVGIVVILILGYTQLSDSKKRYFKYLSQQLPHLISRYFV